MDISGYKEKDVVLSGTTGEEMLVLIACLWPAKHLLSHPCPTRNRSTQL